MVTAGATGDGVGDLLGLGALKDDGDIATTLTPLDNKGRAARSRAEEAVQLLAHGLIAYQFHGGTADETLCHGRTAPVGSQAGIVRKILAGGAVNFPGLARDRRPSSAAAIVAPALSSRVCVGVVGQDDGCRGHLARE